MSEDRKLEETKTEQLSESSLDQVVGGTKNGANTVTQEGKPTLQDLRFTRPVDKSSPLL